MHSPPSSPNPVRTPPPAAEVARHNAERRAAGKVSSVVIGCVALGLGAGLCLVPWLLAYGIGLIVTGLFLVILGLSGRGNANPSPGTNRLEP